MSKHVWLSPCEAGYQFRADPFENEPMENLYFKLTNRG